MAANFDVAAKFDVVVVRGAPVIATVILYIAVSSLATANMALVVAKESLDAARISLVAARVLGKFLEQYPESS